MDNPLIQTIRDTLADVENTLHDINSYLTDLRRQTEAEIAELERRKMRTVMATMPDNPEAAEAVLDVLRPKPRDVSGDPRYPYLAGRQPRRDGDSFGSVLPHDDDPPGTVRPPGKR